jgi:hypothetical protein
MHPGNEGIWDGKHKPHCKRCGAKEPKGEHWWASAERGEYFCSFDCKDRYLKRKYKKDL